MDRAELLIIPAVALGARAMLLYRAIPRIRKHSHSARQKRASELANSLAVALLNGQELTAGHPYYGGMGFRYSESTFIFGSINDGYISSPSEARTEVYKDENRIEFAHRGVFEAWVAGRLCEDDCPHSHPWLSIRALEAGAL